MIKLERGDVAYLEIHGIKFYISHNGGGFAVSRGSPRTDHDLAYFDLWYLDPERLDENLGFKIVTKDPVGPLMGCLQMVIQDVGDGDPVARAVWHGDEVCVSVADGCTNKKNGETYFSSEEK